MTFFIILHEKKIAKKTTYYQIYFLAKILPLLGNQKKNLITLMTINMLYYIVLFPPFVDFKFDNVFTMT
jgi:hypothetical protein